ncbi:sulfite exporter TauE/SafE family protein [Desulforamulus aquiferis]|uniref:Probable membrane transporter protein n=1 Tax=Desulforamulus aquiferis TaxID=1397668 RepID=A0AAW7ZGI5_9FIRM|nr:sulfite exporter TauE/SafE family protein [Desulforamulus aquiferis]MDO7788536.1 sulfite exporter TauE/SafE family protein [Desulforamulus aquiferis]
MRGVYEALMSASRAHARWELEMSNNIIKSRKHLLILAVMLLPIIIPAIGYAADLPGFIGGKSAYGPSHYTPTMFYGSMAIGVCAGLITGCIGAGGGFVITPALMSLGVKGILAVGTDQFHIFAKAIMGTVIHKKLGNVNIPLAIAFLCGSGIGVTAGGTLNRALFNMNPVFSDFVISAIYVVMLGFLGFYSLYDFIKARGAKDSGDAHGGPVGMTKLAIYLQKINLKPMVKFDEDLGGRQISGWFVAICGAVVGFTAAILGVGGGFLTFPMFVYGLGVSSFTTVGTDILQIIFTAGYSSISQYAIYGYIFYTLAMGMLVGSLLGIQIGAATTKVVPGIYIRAFYAIAILAGFVNRLFALPEKMGQMGYIKLTAETGKLLADIGAWIFFGLVLLFAGWILIAFLRGIPVLRGEAEGSAGGKGVSH